MAECGTTLEQLAAVTVKARATGTSTSARNIAS